MDNTISWNQLEEHLKPLIILGEIKLKGELTDDGFKIEVYEHEESRTFNKQDAVEVYVNETKISTIFTDREGEVKLIEHPFGVFTKSNKEIAPLLLNLIGQQIEIGA